MSNPRSRPSARSISRRSRRAWAVACALAALAVHPGRPEAADNLLRNPGFEAELEGHAWMPAAWDTSDTGLPTAFFGRDTLIAREGRYSVNVANVSTYIPMAFNWSQRVLVKPEHWNRDAVFSVWTRSNGVEGRAYVLLQAYRDTISRMAAEWNVSRDEAMDRLRMTRVDDPITDYGWRRQFFSDNTTDWVRREVRVFLHPGTNVLFVRCGLFGTGQVILDDAQLAVAPAEPPRELKVGVNLLADPGFEGDGNDWEYSMPPYRGLRVEADTSLARTGRASLLISGTSGMMPARSGVGQVIGDRSIAGKRIRVSAWGRPDSLKTNASIKIFFNTPRGVEAALIGPPLHETSPWSQLKDDLDVPADALAVWVWFSIDTPTEGRIHWDDTSVQVLGPAASTSPTGSSGSR